MNKIWHLSTCDTNKRIIKELGLRDKNFQFQNIKEQNISKEDLEHISKITRLKFEELFNKRAQKYTKTNLKEELKTEGNFKKAILEEYTFLKRPIIQIGNKFFVGNNKKVIEEVKKELKMN